ncbi:nSTAND1 domain-containing NTPase [Thiohalorhabdus denitrificans]|nr:AAA family ATPase [Thiohalorhabdus denitrificans]
MFGTKNKYLQRKTVENAFQPAKEVSDPERFAGRRGVVESSYYGLIDEGSNIAIVGNRGVGKTSLARQILAISEGDNSLLNQLGLPSDEVMDFLPIYFSASRSISSFQELLHKILTAREGLWDWVYDVPKAKEVMESYTPKFSAGVASLGGEKKEVEQTASAIDDHDVETVFTNIVQEIVKERIARDGILIVIDEFDQIQNPEGFASFLKSLSTNAPKVKFVIVGVAQDIQNLIREHQSSDRLFAGSIVKVPPMEKEELRQIVRIAERHVSNKIEFDEEATEKLVSLAQGHPYMVHLIGKFALREAFMKEVDVIGEEDIQATLRRIAESEADPILEGRYKTAVASSRHRELVLKAMAEMQSEEDEVFTGTAYKLALDWGVDNASQFVGHLTSQDYGGELIKVRDRYYRFRDSLFAAYVKARPNLY